MLKSSGLEKVSMLMMVVNQDTAGKVFGMLDDQEIRDISHVMSNLGNVAPDAVESLITEFCNEINSTQNFVGNVQNTERLLRKILAKEKVDTILEDIRGPAGRNIWDKLGNVSEEVLANYLKNEHPQTVALVLSRLPSIQAAKVITIFNQEFAFEVIKRLLAMDSVKKEVLDRVEKTLRTEFISSLTKTQKHDNNQIMAEIFNNFDRANESKFMGLLEAHSKDAAEGIKRLMFTFNDLMRVDNGSMQAILKSIDKAKLPIALKGASPEIRDKFTNSMSQRAAKILLEEIEAMGPVRIKDVDEAQSEIITVTKDLISKGEVELLDPNESDQVVY